MKKVIVSEMVTLDGFIAGPNGEIDWHNVDAEFNEFAIAQLDSVDTLIFGRVTYQLMADFWPTPAGTAENAAIAERMNKTQKVVFSRTLERLEWQNCRLVKGNVVEEVRRLKDQPGKDMVIFGSGTIVTELTKHCVVDEYRLFVNPVVLGNGIPVIRGVGDRILFRLLDSRRFANGNVLLFYGPIQE